MPGTYTGDFRPNRTQQEKKYFEYLKLQLQNLLEKRLLNFSSEPCRSEFYGKNLTSDLKSMIASIDSEEYEAAIKKMYQMKGRDASLDQIFRAFAYSSKICLNKESKFFNIQLENFLNNNSETLLCRFDKNL